MSKPKWQHEPEYGVRGLADLWTFDIGNGMRLEVESCEVPIYSEKHFPRVVRMTKMYRARGVFHTPSRQLIRQWSGSGDGHARHKTLKGAKTACMDDARAIVQAIRNQLAFLET